MEPKAGKPDPLDDEHGPVELTPLGATLADLQDRVEALEDNRCAVDFDKMGATRDKRRFIREAAIQIFTEVIAIADSTGGDVDHSHYRVSAWRLARALWEAKPEDC